MRRRAALASLAALVAGAPLAGCGFKLRGAAEFPFKTINIDGSSPLLVELARYILAGSNAEVVRKAQEADAVFVLLGEAREKVILSLNTQGRVREFQLRYRVIYRVHDGKGAEFIPANEVVLRRDISFNDQVLAKEAEEQLLYRDMQNDMVQQIIRRMQASRLRRDDD